MEYIQDVQDQHNGIFQDFALILHNEVISFRLQFVCVKIHKLFKRGIFALVIDMSLFHKKE